MNLFAFGGPSAFLLHSTVSTVQIRICPAL